MRLVSSPCAFVVVTTACLCNLLVDVMVFKRIQYGIQTFTQELIHVIKHVVACATLQSFGLAHSDKFLIPRIWCQIFYDSFLESLSFGGQIEKNECYIKGALAMLKLRTWLLRCTYIARGYNSFIFACTPTLSEDIHCDQHSSDPCYVMIFQTLYDSMIYSFHRFPLKIYKIKKRII